MPILASLAYVVFLLQDKNISHEKAAVLAFIIIGLIVLATKLVLGGSDFSLIRTADDDKKPE